MGCLPLTFTFQFPRKGGKVINTDFFMGLGADIFGRFHVNIFLCAFLKLISICILVLILNISSLTV